jgi:hypothetical protein
MKYRIKHFELEDYETQNDKSHLSVSGGIATHRYELIQKREFRTLREVIDWIESNHESKPYVFKDRIEASVSEFVTASYHLSTIESVKDDELIEIAKTFNLEVQ